MKLSINLLCVAMLSFYFTTINAQVNTELTSTRLKFNEDLDQKAYLWWTGSDLIMETDDTNDSDIGFDAQSDIYFNTNDINRMQLHRTGELSLGEFEILGSNLFNLHGDMALGDGTGAINFYKGTTQTAVLSHDAIDLTLENNIVNGRLIFGTPANIDFYTNATRRMAIDETGRIGIGTDPVSTTQQNIRTSTCAFGQYVNNIYSSTGNTYGVYGRSVGSSTGQRFGVYGYAVSTSTTGSKYAVFGLAEGGGTTYGVYGDANSSSNTSYGVYGRASTNGSTSWAIYGNGDYWFSGSMQNPSDARLKKNITNLNDALDKVMQLKPKNYEFKTTQYDYVNLAQGKQYGFLSQDVERVFPDLVEEGEHVFLIKNEKEDSKPKEKRLSIKSMTYLSFIPILTKAIQEQQVIIEAQKADFEQEISELKAELAAIKQLLEKQIEKGEATPTQSIGLSSAALQQNQPNPFDENTSISYFIPNHIRTAVLIVSNLNGQLIKEIAIPDRGQGKVLLEANSLNAGTYQYTLMLDGKMMDTKQMILTR